MAARASSFPLNQDELSRLHFLSQKGAASLYRSGTAKRSRAAAGFAGAGIGFWVGDLIQETGVRTLVHELGHAATYAALYQTHGLHVTTQDDPSRPASGVVQVQSDGIDNAKSLGHAHSFGDFYHDAGNFLTGSNDVHKGASGYTSLNPQHPSGAGEHLSDAGRQAIVSAAGVAAVDLLAMASFAYAAANVRDHPFASAAAATLPLASYANGADYAWTAVGHTSQHANGHDFIEISQRLSHMTGAGAEPVALAVALVATLLPPVAGFGAGFLFSAGRGDERRRQAKRLARWLDGCRPPSSEATPEERQRARRLVKLFQISLSEYEREHPREAKALTHRLEERARGGKANPEAFQRDISKLHAYVMRNIPKEVKKLLRKQERVRVREIKKSIPLRDKVVRGCQLALIPVMAGVAVTGVVARHVGNLAPVASWIGALGMPLMALALGLQSYTVMKEHAAPEHVIPAPVKRLSKISLGLGFVSLGLAAGVMFGGPVAAPACLAGLLVVGAAGLGVFLVKRRLQTKHQAMLEALEPFYALEMRRAFNEEERQKPEKSTVSWAKKVLHARRLHERHPERLNPEATKVMHEYKGLAESVILKSGEVRGTGRSRSFRRLYKDVEKRQAMSESRERNLMGAAGRL